MLKKHFPLRVVAYDADGIQRNVSCIQDILDLAKEKGERYNDELSQQYVAEATNFLTPIVVKGAKKPTGTLEGAGEGEATDTPPKALVSAAARRGVPVAKPGTVKKPAAKPAAATAKVASKKP